MRPDGASMKRFRVLLVSGPIEIQAERSQLLDCGSLLFRSTDPEDGTDSIVRAFRGGEWIDVQRIHDAPGSQAGERLAERALEECAGPGPSQA